VIFFPKILRWNTQGRITQTVKHRADPINAIMLSNAGKKIAVTTNTTMVRIREVTFNSPRAKLDVATVDSFSVGAEESKPVNSSRVVIIGWAFRGIFVRGIIAIRMHIITVRVSGYPDVLIIFEVISSMTSSPNMSSPIIAVAASRKYYSYFSQKAYK
jgi:hypothetical protein